MSPARVLSALASRVGPAGLVAAGAVLAASCTPAWAPAFDEPFPERPGGGVAIAALDDALTFARAEVGGRTRVLAVTRWEAGGIGGVDLAALFGRDEPDAIPFFLGHGYDGLRDAIRDAPDAARVEVQESDLVLPVDFGDRHIAVGTNYPEHADDAGTTRPFLFPKRVQPTAWTAPVPAGTALLDYEVELAVLPLEDLGDGDSPRYLGLLLANDFTDREVLLGAIDRHDVESGKGFTTGKSFPGFLPVGPLLVVPRDYRSFAPGVELALGVGGRLRQRAAVSEMVWDVDEVLARVLARRDQRWEHRGRTIAMMDGPGIPARTLVLTGTPHGTVFSGVPASVIVAGAARWAFGGWSRGLVGQVLDAYVRSARSAGAYLQPGDEVVIHADRLGEIRSRVVP